MSHDEPTLKDIADMLAILKPEQIEAIMKDIPKNNRAYKIDYSARIKRMYINELYFKSAICPHHVSSFEEYRGHDEGIRQQALSGVGRKELILV
jgi:hypothetical protein